MIKLNNYINEAWSGVKKHTIDQHAIDWCEEMGIKDYTINSKGEIDVDSDVDLSKKDFKELPFKFGSVTGYFDLKMNNNLISLKNCPDYVEGFFSCAGCHKLKSLNGSPMETGGDFVCYKCSQLDSLEGCPKEVNYSFYCYDCKRKFTKKEVLSLCKVNQYRISI